MQGRFTSPDEFKGGPDELYDFEEDASSNPTFYADLTNPQSLNKYQYTYNNPHKYTDPTGHSPCCLTVPAPIEVVLPRIGPVPAGTFTYPLIGPVPNIAMWDEAGNGLDRAGNIVKPAPPRARPSPGVADIRRADDTNTMPRSGPKPKRRPPAQPTGGREGKPFTPKGRREVIDKNKQNNGGRTKCEDCGITTVKPKKPVKGVSPSPRETNVDHVNPKSKGGSGSPDNGQVLCRGCNITKSNKVP